MSIKIKVARKSQESVWKYIYWSASFYSFLSVNPWRHRKYMRAKCVWTNLKGATTSTPYELSYFPVRIWQFRSWSSGFSRRVLRYVITNFSEKRALKMETKVSSFTLVSIYATTRCRKPKYIIPHTSRWQFPDNFFLCNATNISSRLNHGMSEGTGLAGLSHISDDGRRLWSAMEW
jgi:hypothetical protein